MKAASTLGTFLRSFRWGHVRQLDRVSRELLARAWAAGAGPGSEPFTIDLDSTICETYGLQKQGALHHGYTHVRGYHPLLAVAAGTGDVLMARLREGRAPAGQLQHLSRSGLGRRHRSGRPMHDQQRLDRDRWDCWHVCLRVSRVQLVPVRGDLRRNRRLRCRAFANRKRRPDRRRRLT